MTGSGLAAGATGEGPFTDACVSSTDAPQSASPGYREPAFDEDAVPMRDQSWLVQRLERPLKRDSEHPFFGKDNPFAFGGGLANGGLSGEAMDLLRDIWRFDYMGAAEFEFGAVPEALSKIARADLIATTFEIPLSKVEKDWRDKSKAKPKGSATIYVLCPRGWQQEIERRVRAWAKSTYHEDREFRLKENTRLPSALRPLEDYDRDVCGWLELDNGFLFFSDREMWEKACALFGVEVERAAA